MLDTMLRFIFKKFRNLTHLQIQLVLAFVGGGIAGFGGFIIRKIEIVWIDTLDPEFITSAITLIVFLLILAGFKRYA